MQERSWSHAENFQNRRPSAKHAIDHYAFTRTTQKKTGWTFPKTKLISRVDFTASRRRIQLSPGNCHCTAMVQNALFFHHNEIIIAVCMLKPSFQVQPRSDVMMGHFFIIRVMRTLGRPDACLRSLWKSRLERVIQWDLMRPS